MAENGRYFIFTKRIGEKIVEVFVLTNRKKSPAVLFVANLMMALAIISIILACMGYLFTFLAAVIFLAIWYFMNRSQNKEYECAYFDGEFRFAKIINKSKRKNLGNYGIDSIVTIAPAGDGSLYNYENDNTVKVHDYTSGRKDVSYYEIVVKDATKAEIIKAELDDRFLDEVCKKYRTKVKR